MPASAASAPVAGSKSRGAGVSASVTLRVGAWALVLVGIARLVASVDGAAYRNDFAHYYLSATLLLAGENPYVTPLKPHCDRLGLEYDPRISRGGNPPLLTRAVTAVAWLPLPAAYWAWTSLQAAALGALLVAMRRVVGLDMRDGRWLLLVGGVLNTTSLQRQFHYSQVQIMVAACLAAALLLHIQNRRTASCALAAFAAAFKLYPAVLIPWFLLAGHQGWRDLARRCLAMAAVGVAVLAVTGVEAWRSFVVDGLPVINQSVGGSLTNYSLPAVVSTMAGAIYGWPLSQEASLYANMVGKGLAVIALGAAYLVTWRRRLNPVAALGLLTAAMMSASLVCWSHYFVLMFVPIAWLWRQAIHPGGAGASWPLLIAGTLCLWPELDWRVPLAGGLPRLALHFYPLAALGIASLLLATSPSRAEAEVRQESSVA